MYPLVELGAGIPVIQLCVEPGTGVYVGYLVVGSGVVMLVKYPWVVFGPGTLVELQSPMSPNGRARALSENAEIMVNRVAECIMRGEITLAM